jgi:23S rRNA pseudouridine1911/1915/1917 synthase
MSSSHIKLAARVPAQAAGRRLDQALASLFPDYSRTRLKAWIDEGKVLVDGRQLRPRDRLVGGEAVQIDAQLEDEVALVPQPIALEIVYEDATLLVINKPVGLVVHPGAGNPDRTMQNALLAHDPGLSVVPRAGIVHRLDKDTSGLLVVARTLEAQSALVRMLEAREIHREYEAVCSGVMTAGGTVDAPIGRHPVDRVRMAIREDGRESVTHYRVLARFRAHTHVRVMLETGRTHQIRVHLAHAGYPIVGDATYGRRLAVPKAATPRLESALRGFRRQALHAARLSFEHPMTGGACDFSAPVPGDMRELLDALWEDAASATAAGKRA